MKLSWKRQSDLKLYLVSVSEYKHSMFFSKDKKCARIVQISRNHYYLYVCDIENDFISHTSYSTFTRCLEGVCAFFNCI